MKKRNHEYFSNQIDYQSARFCRHNVVRRLCGANISFGGIKGTRWLIPLYRNLRKQAWFLADLMFTRIKTE